METTLSCCIIHKNIYIYKYPAMLLKLRSGVSNACVPGLSSNAFLISMHITSKIFQVTMCEIDLDFFSSVKKMWYTGIAMESALDKPLRSPVMIPSDFFSFPYIGRSLDERLATVRAHLNSSVLIEFLNPSLSKIYWTTTKLRGQSYLDRIGR